MEAELASYLYRPNTNEVKQRRVEFRRRDRRVRKYRLNVNVR